MAVVQKTKKRQVEKDTRKSLHVVKVAVPPARVEPPVATRPQGEHSRTVVSLAVFKARLDTGAWSKML